MSALFLLNIEDLFSSTSNSVHLYAYDSALRSLLTMYLYFRNNHWALCTQQMSELLPQSIDFFLDLENTFLHPIYTLFIRELFPQLHCTFRRKPVLSSKLYILAHRPAVVELFYFFTDMFMAFVRENSPL